MSCQGCGSILINYRGEPEAIGDPSDFTQTYYDPSKFAQPTGLGIDGFGTTERNYFRRPAQWNVDFSIFKAFPMGRFRPEFRIDISNLFNHTNWGAPNTSFTSPLFLTFAPGNAESGTNTPGARRMTLGLRVQF